MRVSRNTIWVLSIKKGKWCETQQEDDVKIHRAKMDMWPQWCIDKPRNIRTAGKHQRLEEGRRGPPPESLERTRPSGHLDFRPLPLQLWDEKFLLLQATQILVLRYGNPSKRKLKFGFIFILKCSFNYRNYAYMYFKK